MVGRAGGGRGSAGGRLALAALALSLAAASVAAPVPEAADEGLERFCTVRLTSVSKFGQNIYDAPSAVTIVSAEDIRLYGWRTLAEVLRAQRGFYTVDDRIYTYLGVRGLGRTGDNNNRVLLLIDGLRLNDPLYDQAMLGREGPVDLELVERIEISRGPGSAVYGGNAFFAVINVVTKGFNAHEGLEAGVEAGSWGQAGGRLAWARTLDNDAQFLVSASYARSDGQDLYFPEHGATAHGLDGERRQRLYARYTDANLTLGLIHARRYKELPNAPFGSAFRVSPTDMVDTTTVAYGRWLTELAHDWSLATQLHAGHYGYLGRYSQYEGADLVEVRDDTPARWWGGELTLTTTALPGQLLLLGLNYEAQYLHPRNYRVSPHEVFTEVKGDIRHYALFASDEITLAPGHKLNVGLRYDYHGEASDAAQLHPRLGYIWLPNRKTTLKFLAGSAYRHPNYYECCYPSPGVVSAAEKTETIRTYEVAAEYAYTPELHLSGSVYRNEIEHHINQEYDPATGETVFTNAAHPIVAQGVELEAERYWPSGAALGASYSLQLAEEGGSGATPVNSPRHLVKLRGALPLAATGFKAGAELQYVSSRRTLSGNRVGGYWLANLNLYSNRLAPGLDLSLGVYNLFDADYADPAAPFHVSYDALGNQVALDRLAQDGRHFRVKLDYRF